MNPVTIVIILLILAILVALVALSIRIVKQWERIVVLYLGRFVGVRGPGLVFIVPFLNTVPYRIDLRVITTSFTAEQTLTMDTVPVNVDAVLFWKVTDVEKAALQVEDYRGAVLLAAQTALRDVIGKTVLADNAGRQGDHRPGAPEDDPEQDRRVGDRRPFRGDPRRGHPHRAPGRDVDAGTGGA